MFPGATADDLPVVWLWVLGGLVLWSVLATFLALVIGRGIRMADLREASVGPAPVAARVRRRAVPLPPVGIALAALAVALMTTGYGFRLAGARGPIAQTFSMDAPYSLPRLYVAALFGAAALAAVAGAGVTRRTWWLAVGCVAAGIAAVKTGSTVHVEVMRALAASLGRQTAVLVSVLAATVVVAVLWFVSRTDRRDRRRVLGALAGYAVAAVGLSAVSSVAPAAMAVTATFLEEAGEALAGVAFLMAVLVGVAPRLVLPVGWALRRAGDAETLEVVEPVGDPVV